MNMRNVFSFEEANGLCGLRTGLNTTTQHNNKETYGICKCLEL